MGAAELGAAGTFDVDVERPGVGATAPLPFEVTGGGGAPVLTRLEPDTVATGSPDTQVRLVGGGFTPAAQAFAGAQMLATGYVSAQELLATLPAGLLAADGVLDLTVQDAGGTSNVVSLTVGAAAPTGPAISLAIPTRIWALAGDTRINVQGEGFDPAGTLTFDGVPIATEFSHPGGVSGVLPAAALVGSGPHALAYRNPPAAGGDGPPIDLESVPLPLQALVTLLAGGAGGVYGVAMNATHAFWVDWNTGDVSQVPLAGGAPVVLASQQERPYAIAVNDTHVFWTNEAFGVGQGSVRAVPLAGGAPIPIAAGLSGPHFLALTATHVWVTETWSGQLSRAPLGGPDRSRSSPRGRTASGPSTWTPPMCISARAIGRRGSDACPWTRRRGRCPRSSPPIRRPTIWTSGRAAPCGGWTSSTGTWARNRPAAAT